MVLVQPDRLTPQARRQITDVFHRPLRSLRLSVTDRCNLRCQYCMPEEDYLWLPREDLLTFKEICTLVSVFTDLGVDKVRLTGGEPLLPRRRPWCGCWRAIPDHGPGLDDERRAVGGTGTGSLRGWAPSRHREPGYASRTVSRRSRTVTLCQSPGGDRDGRPGSRASSSIRWSCVGTTTTSWSI